jgi:carbamoyl-phosphate synthase large subunit
MFGEDSKVFTCDLDPATSPACRSSDQSFKAGYFKDDDYVGNLLENCRKHQIDLVIPTVDTELLLLANSKAEFAENGVQTVVSSADLINIFRDKRKTNQFFEGKGIAVPKDVDASNPSFPMFVKPIAGSSSQDIFSIQSEDQLSKYMCDPDKFVHQELLSPNDFEEFTLDLYYDRNSDLKCVVPRKRMAVRGGEISKGMTCKNSLIEFVKSKLSKLNGAIGCITLQLFLGKNSDQVYGIEINPRFGGGYPLSYLAGANYPKMLFTEYFLKQPVEFVDDWQSNLMLLRYDAEMVFHESEG